MDFLGSDYDTFFSRALGSSGDTVYALEVDWLNHFATYFVRASSSRSAKQKLHAHLQRTLVAHADLGCAPYTMLDELGWSFDKHSSKTTLRSMCQSSAPWTGSWVTFFTRHTDPSWEEDEEIDSLLAEVAS